MLGLDSGAVFIDFYPFFFFFLRHTINAIVVSVSDVLGASFIVSSFRLVIVVVCASSFVIAIGHGCQLQHLLPILLLWSFSVSVSCT